MIKSVLALVGFAVVASLLMQGVGHMSNETGLTTRISREIDKHVTPTEKEMAADFLYETVRIISIPQTEAYKLAYRLAGKEYEGDVADARQLLLDTGFIENADGTWNGLLCVAAEVLTDPLSYVAVAGASKRAVKIKPKLNKSPGLVAKELGVEKQFLGEVGEAASRRHGKALGNSIHNAKLPGNRGFDSVEHCGRTNRWTVGEAKANSARLGKGQMSEEWVDNNIKLMSESGDPRLVELAAELRKAKAEGRLDRRVDYFDTETGTLKSQNLDTGEITTRDMSDVSNELYEEAANALQLAA